ncbi:MAG: acyl carrier protein [Pirellulaceae bacterium]|jgi:acyl carrier protein
MSTSMHESIRQFILEEFLPGEDPEQLLETTPLITGGILDSLATLKMVEFLEKTFSIRIEAHEADVDNLDTLEKIAGFVNSKLNAEAN